MINGVCISDISEMISSKLQTKEWRKVQGWYVNGKQNECEKYQRQKLENITDHPIHKTLYRLNIESYDLKELTRPMKTDDGYEWTENFDGMQTTNQDDTLLYNLKMICGQGGAQTRALREVYHFIHTQIKFLLKTNRTTIYFVNILEGDCSFKARSKFIYLISKNKYKPISQFMFVGDLQEFSLWYLKRRTEQVRLKDAEQESKQN